MTDWLIRVFLEAAASLSNTSREKSINTTERQAQGASAVCNKNFTDTSQLNTAGQCQIYWKAGPQTSAQVSYTASAQNSGKNWNLKQKPAKISSYISYINSSQRNLYEMTLQCPGRQSDFFHVKLHFTLVNEVVEDAQWFHFVQHCSLKFMFFKKATKYWQNFREISSNFYLNFNYLL